MSIHRVDPYVAAVAAAHGCSVDDVTVEDAAAFEAVLAERGLRISPLVMDGFEAGRQRHRVLARFGRAVVRPA